MKIPRLPIAASSGALFSLLSAVSAGAVEFDFDVLVRRGDQAPGVAPGLLFEHFGTQQSLGGNLAAPPRLGEDGTVSFTAFLGDGNPATVESAERGMWKLDAGSLELFRFVNDPAPGTSDVFSGFTGVFAHTPIIADGELTILGSIGNVNNPEIGIWSERFGPLELVLLTGDALPDHPAGETIYDFRHAQRGDQILVNGFFTEGSSLTFRNEGLWRNRNGTWETILVKNGQVPEMPPGVVFETDSSQRGPISNWDANENLVIVAGAMAGPNIDNLNNEAIWIETPTGLQMIAREGEPAPGLAPNERWGASTGFRAFGDSDDIPVTLNSKGSLLIGAAVHSPQFTRARTIWTTRKGFLEFLVRGFRPLPGNPPGDPAPGFPEGIHFSHFIRGIINDDDEIAFWGFVDNSATSPHLGIWWDRPGRIELVAGETLPVPALPGVTFTSVTLLDFTDTGHLFYEATLAGAGIGPLNDFAVFMVEPDGTHSVLLHEGDQLDFSLTGDGSDLRTVDFFAVAPGITTESGRVLEVFFTDGSTALYLATPRTQTTDAPRVTVAGGFHLEPSRPNPLRAGQAATIAFTLPSAGPVSGAVYDAGGRRVRTLANDRFEAGSHGLTWDGRDENGRAVSAGVYFARVETVAGSGVRRVVLVR